jgi:Tfp pilus assembly protein PilN
MSSARLNSIFSNDILFINRPYPPENIDIVLFIEDQITELLLADETLSDTVYRFSENNEDLLIAVARKKALGMAPMPVRGNVCYRIPSAIDLWTKARKTLRRQPETPAILFGIYGDRAYLVYANANSVLRVIQVNSGEDLDRDLLLGVEKIQKFIDKNDGPLKFISIEKLSETVLDDIRRHSIELDEIEGNKQATDEPLETFVQWDFRLDNEINDQDLGKAKKKALITGLLSIAATTALWLLMFGTNILLEQSEERSTIRWRKLHGSLDEIAYLQKQIRQSISEITLCKTLSEKRTGRAVVLEKIAATRPAELKLEQIRIGELRKRIEKDGGSTATEDAVILKGFSENGNLITDWMDLLVKSRMFSGVTLVSMEKKGGVYRFQIECAIGTQQKPVETGKVKSDL